MELLQEYYKYLEGSHSPKSIKIYKWHLDSFEKYLFSIKKNLHLCNAIDIQSYVRSRKWGVTAQRHFYVIVKTFFSKYYSLSIPIGITQDELRYKLQRENDIRSIINIPLPKMQYNIENKAMNLIEVKTFLEYAIKKDFYEYCLIWMLLYFGMRKNELLSISPLKHIDMINNKLTISADISKNHRERELYFNDYTKKIIINIIRKFGNKERVCGVNEFYLNNMLTRYDKVIGRHIHPHTFRHTWITEMQKSIKGKIDLDEITAIKILAGHSVVTSDMTAHYTNYETCLKDIMVKYHYLNQFI